MLSPSAVLSLSSLAIAASSGLAAFVTTLSASNIFSVSGRCLAGLAFTFSLFDKPRRAAGEGCRFHFGAMIGPGLRTREV